MCSCFVCWGRRGKRHVGINFEDVLAQYLLLTESKSSGLGTFTPIVSNKTKDRIHLSGPTQNLINYLRAHPEFYLIELEITKLSR